MTKADKERQRKAPILRFKGFNDDWEQRKLSDFTHIIVGGTPSTKKNEYWNGNIPWMSSGEINKKRIYKTDKSITKLGLENLSAKFVPKNSVLIALAGQGKTRGKVAINNIELTINQSLAGLIPTSESYYEFIFYNLEKRYSELRRLSSGAGSRGGLNKKLIQNIKIQIPDLREQTLISKLSETLDKVLTLYDRKLKLLSQVKKYFLDNLFAEKEYPNLRFKYFKKDKWEKTSLNSIVTYSNGKAHEKEINNKGNLDLVMMNSITTGGRLITKKKILSPQDTLNKNDIVIVLSDIAKGELIGKSSVIPCDNQYVLNQRIGCLHPTLNIDSFFVSKYINQKNRYFKSHAAGTSQINLSKSDVLNCTIYIPKVDEQHCVSNFIINVEKIINFYEYKKRHIIQIKNILLNTMFI